MKGTVLVVDDTQDVRNVLVKHLQQRGYRVTAAATGAAGLEAFKKERPDVVLLDVHMPDLDGIEVLRALKELDETAGIIIMTGDPNGDRARMALDEGACDFVRKPIDMDYLDKTLEANVFIRRGRGAS